MTETYKQTDNPDQEQLIARAFDLLFEKTLEIIKQDKNGDRKNTKIK